MSVETQNELQQLKEEIVHLKAELFTLQKNQSSRRGLDGGKGDRGERGLPGRDGRDAVIKIVQADGKVQVVDSNDKVHAEIVAIPGPVGAKGDSIVGPAGKDSTVPGPEGRPGVSPNVDEVVAKVVKQIGSRLI